jgi:ferric-dicitrate binding protein FerR (iron transport regulator)
MSRERFEELLPWYVNGTASAEDRAWVERYLEQHPQERSELAWYQSLQTRLQEAAPAVPETIGLAKTLKLIRGDQPSFAERVSAFFANLGMRPAAAMAVFAVVAVQGVAIVNLLGEAKDDATEIRALRATQVKEGPLLKLNLAPEAKEADIRLLLVSIDGQLVGGPGQLGDYYVRVPAGQEAQVLERLKAQPIVQAAALAPGLPPRE